MQVDVNLYVLYYYFFINVAYTGTLVCNQKPPHECLTIIIPFFYITGKTNCPSNAMQYVNTSINSPTVIMCSDLAVVDSPTSSSNSATTGN